MEDLNRLENTAGLRGLCFKAAQQLRLDLGQLVTGKTALCMKNRVC